jgi:hypothetical protein
MSCPTEYVPGVTTTLAFTSCGTVYDVTVTDATLDETFPVGLHALPVIVIIPDVVAVNLHSKVFVWPAAIACENGVTDDTVFNVPPVTPSAEVVTAEASTNPMFVTDMVTVKVCVPMLTWPGLTESDEVRIGAFDTTFTFAMFVFTAVMIPEFTSAPVALPLKLSAPMPTPVNVHVNDVEVPPAMFAEAGTGPVRRFAIEVPYPVTVGATLFTCAPPVLVTVIITVITSTSCLTVAGCTDIEAVSSPGAWMAVSLLTAADDVFVMLLNASYPTANELNEMFPAAAAEYVHTKFVFAPEAMFAGVADVITEAFPAPTTVGVTGSTEFAVVPPLFTTFIVTVMNCPTDTWTGADTSEAVRFAELRIVTLFEPVVLAVKVVPLAWSKPLADAENTIAPAELASYTHT